MLPPFRGPCQPPGSTSTSPGLLLPLISCPASGRAMPSCCASDCHACHTCQQSDAAALPARAAACSATRSEGAATTCHRQLAASASSASPLRRCTSDSTAVRSADCMRSSADASSTTSSPAGNTGCRLGARHSAPCSRLRSLHNHNKQWDPGYGRRLTKHALDKRRACGVHWDHGQALVPSQSQNLYCSVPTANPQKPCCSGPTTAPQTHRSISCRHAVLL
jgi:hypothetical protein